MTFKVIPLGYVLFAALLSGCGSTPEAPSPDEPDARAHATDLPLPSSAGCDSAIGDALVGKAADAALLEQVRQRSGARTLRVLRPHDVITLEYDSQRLNLETDEGGTIQRAYCG
ncbi:I78 family peptidase inhibitor [Pseudomonas sp. RIT-PI-AD]|uniref:I78 family peptidase inhibitor n=1 Tax=Pseudomonas sp. RIT-PI-AD TaxID=3035294 RepID=UPI0021D9DE87|nr:I78 family peptidase inhibitor [Pseudomonas sp. RIT-PI-AD]